MSKEHFGVNEEFFANLGASCDPFETPEVVGSLGTIFGTKSA